MIRWGEKRESQYQEKVDELEKIRMERCYLSCLDKLDDREKRTEYYKKNGLPRVRLDYPIHNIEEYVIFSETRFECTISMDNDIRDKEADLIDENIKRYNYFKSIKGDLLERLGLFPKPKGITVYYTIKGSQGECEEVTEYPGLTKEQVKEMRLW